MNNISFQSRIRPVNSQDFNKLTRSCGLKNLVDYPWTVKESVLAKEAYTKNVFDCTVCGITDGLKVLLMHICPTREENQNFKQITDFIKSKIDIKNPDLQGFLFGSKNLPFVVKKSSKLFENFESFFEENNIPYSKISGGLHYNDVAYSSATDEWLIKHELLENPEIKKHYGKPEKFLREFYNEVEIAPCDDVSW